jgi:hypothetical protein
MCQEHGPTRRKIVSSSSIPETEGLRSATYRSHKLNAPCKASMSSSYLQSSVFDRPGRLPHHINGESPEAAPVVVVEVVHERDVQLVHRHLNQVVVVVHGRLGVGRTPRHRRLVALPLGANSCRRPSTWPSS